MNTSRTAGRRRVDEATLAAQAAVDADARENFDNPDWRRDALTDLTETIWEGFQHENLLELFTTVENADEGERILIEEVRGLKVHWFSLGGTIHESDIDERVWELRPSYVGFGISRHEKKLKNGFSRAAAQLQTLAIQQMDAEISARLFRTWQAAITVGSDYYASTAGVSLPTVETMITEVQDETLDGEVTIVGRGPAVNALMSALRDENTYAPETNDNLIRLGVVGNYWGATIVRLKNFKDLYDRSFFPANELWFLGRDGSKVGFWGGLTTRETLDFNGYWRLKGFREAGFAVHQPENARRLVNSSISAGTVVTQGD